MSDPTGAIRALDGYPHRFDLVTRRSDCVGRGHIPNAMISSYFDDAREAVHSAIMGEGMYDDPDRPSLVLGEIGMRFLAEVTFPGPLSIGVGLTRVGTASLDEVAGFFRGSRCHVLAWCTMVRLEDGRPAPFTEEERARLAPFMLPADQPACPPRSV